MRNLLKWLVLPGMLVVLLWVYARLDPGGHVFFPKCPVRLLTGWDCPGCGSQRAVHALLNGDVPEAFRQNALMVLFIPYLLVGFIFGRLRNPNERMQKWRNRLYGERAIYVVLVLIVAFTVWRNVV